MPRYEVTSPDGKRYEINAPEGATQDQVLAYARQQFSQQAAPAPAPQKSLSSRVAQGVGNLAAGAVRGAGSIGATILAPWDMLNDAIDGKGLSLESNRARRRAMDEGLGMLGAETDSLLYQVGKLTGEIAGTAGAGGAAANVIGRAAPGVATAAPNFLQAMRTAGMSANGAGMPVRIAGGAASGALSAGLANPEDAALGGVIGGAVPGAVKIAGAVGQKAGSLLRGPEQTPELAAAVRQAQGAGYVIPPTQARPTLGNRLLEGMAGKTSTAQNASAANQKVTNELAAKALGLRPETRITVDVLDDVRREAGKAYKELSELPARPAVKANSLTNTPGAPAINPSQMVFDLRKARNDATAWFRSYGRTADPDALAKAQAAKSQASQLEGALETYAKAMGRDDLVSEMVKARQLIAKTYSVEDALNAASGSVDARKLAKQLDKGKPLSGELKQAAEFAAQFPRAAQAVEGMGSLPQTSPLDWMAGAGLSGMTANPLGLLAIGARPAARSAALSGPVQRGLIQPAAQSGLLIDPGLLQFGYRAAPLLGGDQ